MKRVLLILVCAIALLSLFFAAAGEEAPIPVATARALADIANAPGASYILTDDIDMSGVDWSPIAFSGTLDGNGHAIYNLSVSKLGDARADAVDGNHIVYDAAYAALFSVVTGAEIRDLTLLNARVDVECAGDGFAACLAGYMTDSVIADCAVSGRVYLRFSGKMGGVAGVVGFGDGVVKNCEADVTLVFLDENEKTKCEQFLGGICACGYVDIDSCRVTIDGYASVHGYVHNGGVMGMYHVHRTGTPHDGYVRDCFSQGRIHFFEHNTDRRAYCAAIIGEPLNQRMKQSGNTEGEFEGVEYKTYDTALLPETCPSPEYGKIVTPPTCTEFGYTAYTCASCGYSYTDEYTRPAHTPGAWTVVSLPDYDQDGREVCACALCGETLETRSIGRLTRAASVSLSESSLSVQYRHEGYLTAFVLPEDAANREVVWSSLDESVASVDSTGRVYGKKAGQTVIACQTADGAARAECALTVKYSLLQWIIRAFYFGWLWY